MKTSAGQSGLAVVLLATLLGVALAGCHAPLADDEIVLAFTMRDTDQNTDKDPRRLAAWIENETGIPTRIYHVSSPTAAIEALRGAHAHATFMDGGAAWIAWQRFDFDALLAEQNKDGRTYYNAQAYVLAESDIHEFEDLRGKRSCHTGMLKSAGMIMPMGYLIGNGFVEVVGDPNDIASLRPTVESFFSEALIPDGGPYSDYRGALRCLTEGLGDVALVRDTTWEEHCTGANAADWCLPRESYRLLPAWGAVPSHPLVVGPDTSSAMRTMIADALLALNDSEEGRSILRDVLETSGLVQVTSEEHLGDYLENARHVPGLQAYVAAELGLEP
jgi:ABC-type phosphate/phosphonate transport system substrate-binding protein